VFDELFEKCMIESEIGSSKFYHVSTKDLGSVITLKPRDPGVPSEPSIPRISVAPTVAGCVMSISSLLQLFPASILYVYQTVDPVKTEEPKGVPDVSVTGELWILNDTRFKKIDEINVSNFSDELWKEVISIVNVRDRSQIRDDLSAELKKLY
jgi:hypothetical protein